jgi:Kef-type K+ transport system membrane component KefB
MPMERLSPHDIMTMFLALAALLGTAKIAGELMQKLDQPSVLGEIMAGILLGPTVLGRLKPAIYQSLFPSTGNMPIVLASIGLRTNFVTNSTCELPR